jgi:hypothetical protein
MSKIEPIDIEEAIEEMSDTSLRCRDFRHSWAAFTVTPQSYGYERSLRCRDCKSLRNETLNRRGSRVGDPKYVYSEGYLIKGLGRLTADDRDALRLASLLRSIPKDNSVKPKPTTGKKKTPRKTSTAKKVAA